MNDVYSRTAHAVQGDTLDAVCHRHYAERATTILPALVELNPTYSPFAILPLHAVIILPDATVNTPEPSIKLWD